MGYTLFLWSIIYYLDDHRRSDKNMQVNNWCEHQSRIQNYVIRGGSCVCLCIVWKFRGFSLENLMYCLNLKTRVKSNCLTFRVDRRFGIKTLFYYAGRKNQIAVYSAFRIHESEIPTYIVFVLFRRFLIGCLSSRRFLIGCLSSRRFLIGCLSPRRFLIGRLSPRRAVHDLTDDLNWFEIVYPLSYLR